MGIDVLLLIVLGSWMRSRRLMVSHEKFFLSLIPKLNIGV